MTPHEQQIARLRQQAVEDAFALFQTHPHFASIQIQLHDQIEELKQGMPADAERLNTPARFELAMGLFEIRAKAYLELVANLDFHKAYLTTLEHLARIAWKEYTGYPVAFCDSLYPAGHQIVNAARDRIGHWSNEGYKRLVPPTQPLPPAEILEADRGAGVENLATARGAYLLPILQDRGLTKSRWAAKAGVDPSVVYDYLEGKSNPRAENRKAIAEALGLKASDLPA